MNDLRAAAQQALEALLESVDLVQNDYDTDWQHRSPSRAAQMNGKRKMLEAHTDAITALRAALAEPVQEPVAWMDREGDMYKMPEIEGWAPPHTMLYAAPPQRKPLTEAELEKAAREGRQRSLAQPSKRL